MTDRNHPISPMPPVDGIEPVFAARLFPHRSLGKSGFIILMAFIGVTCFMSGLLFWSIGAWPIFGFLGIDFLAIWIAFKFNYRSGRQFEEVAIWRDNLLVRRISPSGKVDEQYFNPFWTRFGVDRHDEIGITRMFLRGEGREVSLGDFLNPVDRESFARAFGSALATVKS
ncbi:MAG: DUF2244 domain-containing protein [Nitratireductor sp.]